MPPAKRHSAIVFDLEFTAWEGSMAGGWSRPGEYREVVQIGAVKLDAKTLAVVDEFDFLVQPRINPVLSPYLEHLTGITNAKLQRRGVDFITAYRAFLDFTGSAAIWAFGRDDLIFAENLKFYALEAMGIPEYCNVIPWFAELGVDLKGKNACHVAESVGLTFEGQRHDALDDAKGVARGMIAMIEKGASNPFLGP